MKRGKEHLALVCAIGSAVCLVIVGMASWAAAAEKTVSGSYWYIFDNVHSVEENAKIRLWTSIPTDRAGQKIRITDFQPKPLEIIEDHAQGNRIAVWELNPQEGDSFLSCHYEFTAVLDRILTDVDPSQIEPYDKKSDLYQRFTQPGFLIETDGDVLQLAQVIVGEETHPYRQAKLFYNWLLDNMEFWPGGTEDRSARASGLGQRGDCGQYSLLFTALCRSQGIPARTVTCEWLIGGKHRWAEFYLPPYGWIPADASAAQILMPGFSALSREEILTFLDTHDIPPKDPSWLFGNLYRDRLIISVGNNIGVHGAQTGESKIFTSLEPGGADASPPAIQITGLDGNLVHGGFFYFGDEELTADDAHEIAHMELASRYFSVGRYDVVEEGCLKALDDNPDGMQSWLNLGRVYMRKGLYNKAEASFRRALSAVAQRRGEKLQSMIWTHNYLGNCYDLLGTRNLAVAEYNKVLELKSNYHGAVEYARKYLNHPFTKADFSRADQ